VTISPAKGNQEPSLAPSDFASQQACRPRKTKLAIEQREIFSDFLGSPDFFDGADRAAPQDFLNGTACGAGIASMLRSSIT
jgi:hypothetical protein